MGMIVRGTVAGETPLHHLEIVCNDFHFGVNTKDLSKSQYHANRLSLVSGFVTEYLDVPPFVPTNS